MARLRDRILKRYPNCIYCGGINPAVELDHVPPIGLFDGKWRPDGLEMPACKACHSGTREVDLICGLVSRMFPDPETDQQRLDAREMIRSFLHNFPALHEEIWVEHDFVLPDGGLAHGLRANGPILTSAMLTFAARLGLAIHLETTCEIVGPAGAIFSKWYSNAQALRGELPQEFLEVLGPYRTLVSRRSVGDQFSFAVTPTGLDHPVRGYWAEFRKSFATLTLIAPDDTYFAEADPQNVFRPGFLRGYSVKELPWGRFPGAFGYPWQGPYQLVGV